MLEYRFAKSTDVDLLFRWVNEPLVRRFSFNSEPIIYEKHVEWYASKLRDPDAVFFVFSNEMKEDVGLVRIEKVHEEVIVGVLVDGIHRGKSYSTQMLITATNYYHGICPGAIINAYIKADNVASIRSFTNAGFASPEIVFYNGYECRKMIKDNAHR